MSRSRNDLTRRAMRSAIRKGVDPLNSHDVQATAWKKMWADRERREAEREAKAEMLWAAWCADHIGPGAQS